MVYSGAAEAVADRHLNQMTDRFPLEELIGNGLDLDTNR